MISRRHRLLLPHPPVGPGAHPCRLLSRAAPRPSRFSLASSAPHAQPGRAGGNTGPVHDDGQFPRGYQRASYAKPAADYHGEDPRSPVTAQTDVGRQAASGRGCGTCVADMHGRLIAPASQIRDNNRRGLQSAHWVWARFAGRNRASTIRWRGSTPASRCAVVKKLLVRHQIVSRRLIHSGAPRDSDSSMRHRRQRAS